MSIPAPPRNVVIAITTPINTRQPEGINMNLDDLKAEVLRYSNVNGYPAETFTAMTCTCGGDQFTLYGNESGDAALAVCCACEENHSVYDSADFMDDVGQHVCACDAEALHLMIGLAFHEDTTDARWVYVGAKCVACDLVGVYIDWNER